MAMPTKWAKSEAKKILKKDILEGIVPEEMGAKEVYVMHPEYVEYALKNFTTNLRNLRKSIKKLQTRAESDHLALLHDLQVCPVDTVTEMGHPIWNRNPAQNLLKEDVSSGVHNYMSPKELWSKRMEYKTFTLEKFRNHLYQEIRSRKENAYWTAKKKN